MYWIVGQLGCNRELAMGSFRIWHWLMVIVWLLAVGLPLSKILKRIGFSGWWAILAFIPLANIIGLWVLAVTAWPKEARNG
ncbi:hypothetical protein GHK50_30715 [Sinorhizobium medicae]|uniref:DUF805 domain-containing protein n=3 Tax=Sinorhizobium medicae TaxID=110321 RepID=A0A6G1WDF6_9HYPH|nr:hypothetical protein [Sinorhizobium medicae]MQX87248.1 hypothetical protein [Sinorhizobium medicae]